MNEAEPDKTPIGKNKNKKVIRILLIVFCFLIIFTGVSVYVIYGQLTDDDSKSLFIDPRKSATPPPAVTGETGAQSTPVPTTASEIIVYNGKQYARNPNIVNLLFLGIDYTEARAELNLGYRSDVVMVCAVDAAAKKVTMISFPRDTYTTVYDISDTGAIVRTKQNRVNAAFAFGGGPDHYGYDNAMACVQMFLQRQCKLEQPLDFTLNIPVYLYAGIDIDGIAPVAESVGGVEVTMEYTIPDVGRKGETILLKGQRAADYLRDRHNTPGGDLGRATKEQDFMIKLAKKIKSMGAVDIIVNLYDDLQKYVRTNLNTTQMVDFAKILMNVDLDSIQKFTIPGEIGSKSGVSYYFADEQATLDLLLSVYYTPVS